MREANYYSYHVTKEGEVYNKWGAKLKSNDNGRGYQIVGITVAPYKRVTKAIHRLVAEVYLPNPYKLSDVDHIDGDKTNNKVDNLRWCTHGENIKHSFDGERRSARGSKNANAQLTEEEVHDICYLLSNGCSCPQIRDSGYPYVPVYLIRSKRTWKHISRYYSF